MKNKIIIFSFGRNWVDYVNNFLDQKKLDAAKESFKHYLPVEAYKDKTLIDIGCGSGIFSFNAIRMGCSKVVSLDIDDDSINATNFVKEKFRYLLPRQYIWDIFEGSILDKSLVEKLKDQGDIVYSWGVLHHTGSMYKAIDNAASLVKPGGYFIIAIYNKAPSSEFWHAVKKSYNNSSLIRKIALAYFYFSYVILRRLMMYGQAVLLNKKRPFALAMLFERERGMSIFYDVIDWIGGFPYEYATVAEINNYVQTLGFQLIDNPIKLDSPKKNSINRFTFGHTACNEFVFKRTD